MAAFLLGISPRKVANQLMRILGVRVSPSTVSRVAKARGRVVASFPRRSHSDEYGVLVVDGGVMLHRAGAGAVGGVPGGTGTRAAIVEPVGTSEYEMPEETVRAVFYLMRHEGEGVAAEDRPREWHSFDEAIALLSFADARDLLRRAHRLAVPEETS